MKTCRGKMVFQSKIYFWLVFFLLQHARKGLPTNVNWLCVDSSGKSYHIFPERPGDMPELPLRGEWKREWLCGNNWFYAFQMDRSTADEDMRQRKLVQLCNEKHGRDGYYMWAQPETQKYWAMFKSNESAVYGRYFQWGEAQYRGHLHEDNTRFSSVWLGPWHDEKTKAAYLERAKANCMFRCCE